MIDNVFFGIGLDCHSLEEGSGIYRKEPSQWLMTDAADVIFKFAKVRVYKLRKKKKKAKKQMKKKKKRQKTLTGEVIVIDEIGTELESRAAQTIAEYRNDHRTILISSKQLF